MPDLPPLDDAAQPDAKRAAEPSSELPHVETAPAADPPPAATPQHGWFGPGVVVFWVAVSAALLYGAVGFLRETGLYDVAQWWSPASETPSLAALSASSSAPAAPPGTAMPVQKAPTPLASPATQGRSLRDQPPRTPPADLPHFTVRDGEQYDFLTDLDAETLKRLAEIQGQLDGLGAQMNNLHQALQGLVREAGQQRQRNDARQARLQADLTAARQAIAVLQTTIEDVEARLKRVDGGVPAWRSSTRPTATPAGGRTVPGWSVKAVSGHRAWLHTPKGGEVTVVAGERLKALGTVRGVDALQGIVVMSDGRVLR